MGGTQDEEKEGTKNGGWVTITSQGKLIETNNEDAVNQILNTDYGVHYLIVYPNLDTFRDFYSLCIKQQIEEKNDIVLINPFYETTDSVRKTLSDGKADLDISKYEREQSLVIIDSLKQYFGKRNDIIFKRNIAKHAKEKGKNGLFILGDVGAYPFKGRHNDLVDYELSLPTTYENIAMKGFCLYHEKDFGRFSEEQRQKLIEHHGMDIKIKVID